jgi:GAF domain-containing protein/MFS family permease
MNTNSPDRPANSPEQLLARLGGGYIMRVEMTSQLLASILGSAIGLFYVYFVAGLTGLQLILLVASLLFFVVLLNILFPVYVSRVTRNARLRLDYLYKNIPLPEENNETKAWREIIVFPGQSTLMQFITVYVLVIFPTLVLMRWAGGIDWFQTIYILIGGSIAETTAVIQTLVLLDHQLAPARQALIPSSNEDQQVFLGISHIWHQLFASIVPILAAIIMIGLLGYQAIITGTTPGADAGLIIRQFENQVIIIGVLILGVGIITTYLLSKEVTNPIHEILRIMDRVRRNDYSKRALLVTSDENALLTLQFNQILDMLNNSQQSLEHQVKERTEALEQRSFQLQAASKIVREAATLQDLNLLLARTVSLISERFGYYHVGIFLLDEANEYAILQAASSEGGKRMLARGHRLEVGHQGIVGSAAYQNRTRIALDVGVDPVFFDNPDLPTTRSEAAFPLSARNKVIGVLDIQSTEPSAFNRDNLDLIQTMADQIALAIHNARLIAESQNAFRQLEAVNLESVRQTWIQRVEQQKYAYHYSTGAVAALNQDEKTKTDDEPVENEKLRITIPINLRGQQIGRLAFLRKGDSSWGEAERSLAVEIANQVGLALENARLLDEAQRRAAQEQSLSELTTRLSSSLDPDNLLQTTVRELHQLPNVTEVSVYITPSKPSADETTQPV